MSADTCVPPFVRMAILLVAMAAGCGLPRDADHTLDRVRNHDLHVGVTENPPWVKLDAEHVSGVEPSLVGALASELRARLSFRRGSESELLDALRRGELELVVGGFHGDSPWKARIALTKPYYTDTATGTTRVVAVRAGENAWLVHVETFLDAHQAAVDSTLRAER